MIGSQGLRSSGRSWCLERSQILWCCPQLIDGVPAAGFLGNRLVTLRAAPSTRVRPIEVKYESGIGEPEWQPHRGLTIPGLIDRISG